jgi:hypothetical protein
MRRLESRLRQQRREEQRPRPVWIYHDPEVCSAREAVHAAIDSGNVPAHAALVVLPSGSQSIEEWGRWARVEYEERQKQQKQHKQREEPTEP